MIYELNNSNQTSSSLILNHPIMMLYYTKRIEIIFNIFFQEKLKNGRLKRPFLVPLNFVRTRDKLHMQ